MFKRSLTLTLVLLLCKESFAREDADLYTIFCPLPPLYYKNQNLPDFPVDHAHILKKCQATQLIRKHMKLEMRWQAFTEEELLHHILPSYLDILSQVPNQRSPQSKISSQADLHVSSLLVESFTQSLQQIKIANIFVWMPVLRDIIVDYPKSSAVNMLTQSTLSHLLASQDLLKMRQTQIIQLLEWEHIICSSLQAKYTSPLTILQHKLAKKRTPSPKESEVMECIRDFRSTPQRLLGKPEEYISLIASQLKPDEVFLSPPKRTHSLNLEQLKPDEVFPPPPRRILSLNLDLFF